MQPGSLDRRVVIERRVLSRNEYGEEVVEYETLDTVWAQKLDATGREYFAAQGLAAERTARFKLRYRSDLLYTDRLSYGGHTYDIKHIAELGRQDGLEVIAVARET